MPSTKETRRQLAQLLDGQRFAVLATQSGDQPYLSLMAFAASDDLRRLVFVTERETRKYANLAANMRSAVLVDNRSNDVADLRDAIAVTVQGRAEELRGQARDDALELFLRKHPHLGDFARSFTSAVIELHVDRYVLVSQFQRVEILEPDAGADAGVNGQR